jgi:type IV secretory pathway VirB4 component
MAEGDTKMGETGPGQLPSMPPALLVIGMAGAGKTTFMQVNCSQFRLTCAFRASRVVR